MPLDRSFYLDNIHFLAKQLLGCQLVHLLDDGGKMSGTIVEVEAYTQHGDPASHSFRGMNQRNAVMFGQAGHLYVYFTYGMHYCCNVVCGPEGRGDAILIRSLEPVSGIEKMMINRYGEIIHDRKRMTNLTNGPAKLCQAMKIGKRENGADLCSGPITIEMGKLIEPDRIGNSTRVGISQGNDLAWRYFISNNPWVSKTGKGIRIIE